jgi:CheY-like chemotaxis protein
MALVLALEDDRLSQRLIEKVFKNAGHEVHLAASIKTGFDVLRKAPLVDLVVLDSHLGEDVGWDFVAEVRRRPVLRQIPIVVYTGYTERQEVLRYAALKVQAVHVKPIKADILLAELERATRGGARSHPLEDPGATCERLKLGQAEYAALLVAATADLEEDRAIAARHLQSPNGAFSAAADRLKQRSRELGIRRMDELLDLVADQAKRGDRADAVESLSVVGHIVATVRQRAIEMLGTTRAVTGDAAPPDQAASRETHETTYVAPPHHLGGLTRRLLERPLWSYATMLGRVPSAGLSADDLERTLAPALAPGGAAGVWVEALRAIESTPRLDLPDVAKLLADIEAFAPACARIVERISFVNGDAAADLDMDAAAARLGVMPAVMLAAVARIIRVPVASPLDLPPLRHHAALTALLAFELARLFKVPNAQDVGAAALAHQFGFWCVAVAEPGLVALALAATGCGVPLGAAVERTVGTSAQVLGHRILSRANAAALYQEAAQTRLPADETDFAGVSAAVGIVFLAEVLARAAAAEDPLELTRLGERLTQANHPAWTCLRADGLTIPRDMKEIVDAALNLATTFNWVAREATA